MRERGEREEEEEVVVVAVYGGRWCSTAGVQQSELRRRERERR